MSGLPDLEPSGSKLNIMQNGNFGGIEMKEEKGYVILADSGDFLQRPIELFETEKEAKYIAKQTAKDIGDDYKSYKIVKAKISTIA